MTFQRGQILHTTTSNGKSYVFLSEKNGEMRILPRDDKKMSRGRIWLTNMVTYFKSAPEHEQLDAVFSRDGGRFNMELYVDVLEKRAK